MLTHKIERLRRSDCTRATLTVDEMVVVQNELDRLATEREKLRRKAVTAKKKLFQKDLGHVLHFLNQVIGEV